MDEWMFIGLFHNLPVKAPVGNNYISVAPPTDSRIEDLCSRSPAYCRLVDNFTDQFERHRQPSVLLVKKTVSYDMEGLLAFRNALAITSITYTWENVVGHGSQLKYLKYSNYFDFYPYTLSKDEQWFIMHTASQIGLDDEVGRFHGQTSPELATAALLEEFYDKRLLSSLLDKWVDRYVRREKQDRNTAALFRSLDMAYRASVMPQLHLHEFGTNIALWVSAFEILVHPKTGNADRDAVLNFLDGITFSCDKLLRRLYTISKRRRKKEIEKVSLILKIYDEMNSVRNDFLHGNPVTPSKLFTAKSRQCLPLTICAVLVYKCALMSHLNMFKDINRDIDISGDMSSADKESLKNLVKIRSFEQTLMKMREPME